MTPYFYKFGIILWLIPLALVVPHSLVLAVAVAILFSHVTQTQDGSLTINFGE